MPGLRENITATTRRPGNRRRPRPDDTTSTAMETGQKANPVPMEDLLFQVRTWRGLSRKTLKDLLVTIESHKPRRPAERGNVKRLLVMFACTLALLRYGSVETPTKWLGSQLLGSRDKCLIPMPVDPKNTFRPPVDCNFCRNVNKVDVVLGISPNEFESKYAYSGRPVLIKDALTNWTATSVFSFEYFRDLYLGSKVRGGKTRRCQFFPYKTEFRSLYEALSMGDDRRSRPWYFGWSNCDAETANELRTYYARPYFLPERSESSRTDWIFMGTAGLGAHMHVSVIYCVAKQKWFKDHLQPDLPLKGRLMKVDHVSLPSWQAQVRGKKLWILEPPPECFYECQSMDVVVQPGDTIVLDTNIWYHKTNVISDEISITIGSEYD